MRVTVALPVSVATFPIGSPFAAWSGGRAAVAGEVGCAGVGSTCAEMVRSEADCAGAAPVADGVAKTFAGLAGTMAQTSQTASESWCRVTMESLAKVAVAVAGLRAQPAERRMNVDGLWDLRKCDLSVDPVGAA